MAFQADAFVSTGQFLNGGQTAQFDFSQPLNDAFWGISVVARGTNTNVELTRVFTDSDAGGTRRLHYVVRNNTANPTFFTRGAVRIPAL